MKLYKIQGIEKKFVYEPKRFYLSLPKVRLLLTLYIYKIYDIVYCTTSVSNKWQLNFDTLTEHILTRYLLVLIIDSNFVQFQVS